MFCIKLDQSDHLFIFPVRLQRIFFTYYLFLFNPGNCTAMPTLTFETEVVLQFVRNYLNSKGLSG